MTKLRFHRINSLSAVKIRQMVTARALLITPFRKGKTGKINQKLMETATIVMATRMDRRVILIETTGNTTAKNEITANNIEIVVTAGAVTITGIMTGGLVATGITMGETEVMAITEVVTDAKVLVEIFVKTKGVTETGIITTTNTEMAAETEVTTEGPPQIIMNPITTGIISIVGVVDDKFLIAPEIYIRITDEKNSCYNLVSSALNKRKNRTLCFS